jgi:hypothetical protein
MDEQGFPYPKFKLVQQVNNQDLEKIKTQRLELVGKGIL